MRKVGVWMAIALLAACQRNAPEPEAVITPVPSPTSELVYDNINLTETDADGRTIWRLEADRAAYEDQVAQLTAIDGELYTQTGEVIAITAAIGSADLLNRRLALEGDLEISVNDLSLTSTTVEWLPAENQLQAVGDVVIRRETGGLELNGDRVVIDFSAQTLTLTAAAGISAVASEPALNASMSRLIWNLETSEITGEGEIVVTGDALVLSGSVLSYNLLTDTLALSQAAIAQSDQARLSADRITWVINAPETVANGNVRYEMTDVVVEGNQGTANWDTNMFVVDGGRSSTQLVIR